MMVAVKDGKNIYKSSREIVSFYFENYTRCIEIINWGIYYINLRKGGILNGVY